MHDHVVENLLLQKDAAMRRLKCCAGTGLLHEGSDIDGGVKMPLASGLQPFNPTCLALSAPSSAQGAGMPSLGSPWSILGSLLLPEDQLASKLPQHRGADAAYVSSAGDASSPAVAWGAAAFDSSSTAAAEAVLQALDCWSWQPFSIDSSAPSSSTPGTCQHPSPGSNIE